MFTAEQNERYRAAAHAMQSGVAQDLSDRPESGSAKHVRVGINSAMVDTSVIAQLLVAKGIVSEHEMAEALIAGMEAERDRYQQELSEWHGVDIRLA